MDQLPILAFENVLSYLNSLDKYNAIIAFSYDYTALAGYINRKISLAMEYRFRQQMISYMINSRKAFIKELDLTGIYWIPKHIIIKTCLQLVNLENLYLLGTSVIVTQNYIDLQFKELQGLQNITFIAVAIEYAYVRPPNYSIKLNSSLPKAEFPKITVINVLESGEYPIVSENWLSALKGGSTVEDVCREIKHSYTEVSYSDFMAEEEKVKEFFYDLQDEKILLVRQSEPPRVATINIEPIKYLVNLTSLYLDVYGAVGNMFLKPILQSCQNLKKLCIICHNASFSFSHLKHASDRLQDLSICMYSSMFFNISKFFFDINEHPTLRLRRLHLHVKHMALDERFDAQSALAEFMRRNPQLIFVSIVTKDATKKKIMAIARLLKSFKKQPHQSFMCILDDIFELDDIPLQHMDLMNVFLNIALDTTIISRKCGIVRQKQRFILAQMRSTKIFER